MREHVHQDICCKSDQFNIGIYNLYCERSKNIEQTKEHQTPIQVHPVLNIIGEKVALGPIHRDLVSLYHLWVKDFAVLRTLNIPRPSTLEEIQDVYEAEVAQERVCNVVYFTIATYFLTEKRQFT